MSDKKSMKFDSVLHELIHRSDKIKTLLKLDNGKLMQIVQMKIDNIEWTLKLQLSPIICINDGNDIEIETTLDEMERYSQNVTETDLDKIRLLGIDIPEWSVL